MSLFGRKAPPLQIGDRFLKAGDRFGKVWKISRLWTAMDGKPHARLTDLRGQSETRIVSVATLSDPEFFSPAPILED
ncbi:conserved hypothetical protein [Candidatus Terasakiella magnetica]|nr:conserved hypothetical protein [Candidatus Terasakiella magnetica]